MGEFLGDDMGLDSVTTSDMGTWSSTLACYRIQPNLPTCFHCFDACVMISLPQTIYPSASTPSNPQPSMFLQGSATHSISTSTPFGSWATATQLLAGFVPPKCFSYSAFISTKFFISVRNTVILTTLLRSEPAVLRIAERFCMQREALYPILPSGREPSARAGSCPDT